MLLLQISSLLLFKYLGFLNLSHNFFVFWSSKVKFTNSASPTTNIAALPNIHEIIACKWFKNLIVNLKFWVYKFDADHLINGYSYRIHKINLINSNENRVFEVLKMDFKKMVRMRGLEPPRRGAPDPKSGVSANFTTSAQQ